jgi:hypothetical protein
MTGHALVVCREYEILCEWLSSEVDNQNSNPFFYLLDGNVMSRIISSPAQPSAGKMHILFTIFYRLFSQRTNFSV